MMMMRWRARPGDRIGIATGKLTADVSRIAVRGFVGLDLPLMEDRTRDRHEDREQRQRGAERESLKTCRRVTAGATFHIKAQHRP